MKKYLYISMAALSLLTTPFLSSETWAAHHHGHHHGHHRGHGILPGVIFGLGAGALLGREYARDRPYVVERPYCGDLRGRLAELRDERAALLDSLDRGDDSYYNRHRLAAVERDIRDTRYRLNNGYC